MKSILSLSVKLLILVLLASCGTIIGGSKYYAHVKVKDHPNARIEHNGVYYGSGDAIIKAKRSKANKFAVTIKEEGCEEETVEFKQRKFRGWALLGTVVTWTGNVGGIYIPWGAALDFITGSLYKPDENELGVDKIDQKHYNYVIDYKGCLKKPDISGK
ncbi:MAG: hypothetical protein K9I94_00235 [Bacteroidales bacterium]|nr:hypothetical protein [Bacteroidales bacterium]